LLAPAAAASRSSRQGQQTPAAVDLLERRGPGSGRAGVLAGREIVYLIVDVGVREFRYGRQDFLFR
jgi:hypothetical protein